MISELNFNMLDKWLADLPQKIVFKSKQHWKTLSKIMKNSKTSQSIQLKIYYGLLRIMPSKYMSDDFLNFTAKDWKNLLAETNVENAYKLECLYIYLTSPNEIKSEKDEESDAKSEPSESSKVEEEDV